MYVLFDLIHDMPIAEAIYDNIKTNTIKEFIENTIPHHKITLIVTDLKDNYDYLMSRLGFEHQYCIFHLIKNINKKIKKHLNETKTKIEKKIKKNLPELNKKQLKEKVEKKLKIIKKEINLFKSIFLDLFKQKTHKDALKYIKILKYILDDFLKFFAKYLKQEFSPKYKKFLTFLKNPHKEKINSINNKTENYIGKHNAQSK